MSKRAIKILKRKNASAEKKPVFVNHAKVESISRRKIEHVVNNWIYELRENSRAEKTISNGKISAWKSN